MLSQAGKYYNNTKIVNPYNTKRRFRYYQLEPIRSNRKLPKVHQTLDVNLRGKNDSFSLRYGKELAVNTNHSPNHTFIKPTSPRQIFQKGAFERYIGDIRDQDYSKPLPESCDHRCARANNVGLQKMVSTASSKRSSITLMKEESQLETASVRKSERQQLNLSENLNLKRFEMNDLKSTEPSLLIKRSSATIDVDQIKAVIKPRNFKGISFDSSIGHLYLKQLQSSREKIPEMYDLSQQDESMINNNFRKPRGSVEFGKFRNSIATRYDRVDPEWHCLIDTSNCQLPNKDLSYNFRDYSARKPIEVKSKYAIRQSMNLYSSTPRPDIQ